MPEPEPLVVYVFDASPAKTAARVAEADLLPGGVLRLRRADPDRRERLERLFARVNKLPGLSERLPAPEGAARYTVFQREVPRDDPQFFPALREHFEKYYALRLSLVAPAGGN